MAPPVSVVALSGMVLPALPTEHKRSRKLTTIDLVGGIYCHICTVLFETKKEFDRHYLKHNTGTEEITYTCNTCRTSSTSYPSFRGHCYTAHVIKERFKCQSCNKKLSKLSALKEHIDVVHNFKCKQPSCGRRFPSKKDLNLHQVLHKDDAKPPYPCLYCTQEIEDINACEDHIHKHCVFKYFCPICNESIDKRNSTQHMSVHFDYEELNEDDDIDDEEMPVDSSITIVGGVGCCYCKKLFKNRTEIDQHIAEEHPDEDVLYTCVICDKKHDLYYSFAEHCYFHYAKNKFTCETCQDTFPRLSLLVKHSKLHKPAPRDGQPDNNLEQECQLCGLRLENLLSACRHLSVHRRGIFTCPVCRRSYGEKYLLMKHIPMHFETVLHVCKVCHKAFSSRNRLNWHAKTHAPEARGHQCEYCSKSFIQSSQLSQHMNVHTGARPFSCAHCPKTFAGRPNLYKHMRRIHNTDKKLKSDSPIANDISDVIDQPTTSDNSENEQEVKNVYDDMLTLEPVRIGNREAQCYESQGSIDNMAVTREAQCYESQGSIDKLAVKPEAQCYESQGSIENMAVTREAQCYESQGNIDNLAVKREVQCYKSQGSIDNMAVTREAQCYESQGNIDNLAVKREVQCYKSQGSIDNMAVTREAQCYESQGSIDNLSVKREVHCYKSQGSIDNMAVTREAQCYETQGSIDNLAVKRQAQCYETQGSIDNMAVKRQAQCYETQGSIDNMAVKRQAQCYESQVR